MSSCNVILILRRTISCIRDFVSTKNEVPPRPKVGPIFSAARGPKVINQQAIVGLFVSNVLTFDSQAFGKHC